MCLAEASFFIFVTNLKASSKKFIRRLLILDGGVKMQFWDDWIEFRTKTFDTPLNENPMQVNGNKESKTHNNLSILSSFFIVVF
mmetsp:Transcript_34326/g.49898  ORF Transcript_34326/g.49898 Transcript_34326/m.49898 type:complete len:84 (-) Transcript_34326:2401-2652(-)